MSEYDLLCKAYYNKNYNEFLKLFEDYINSSENNGIDSKILFFYAKILNKSRKYLEAIKVLEMIVKRLNPDNFVYFELGRLHRLTNNQDKALIYMQKCVELENAEKPQSTFELAKIYLIKKDEVNAEKYFKLSIEADSTCNVHAYYELGKLYYNQNKLKEAEKIFLEALKQKNSISSHSYYFLGKICTQTGRKKLAEDYFRKCIKLEQGKSPQSFFELGRVLKDQDRFEEAKECFVKANKLNPEKELVIKYELAKMYILERKYDEAEKLLLYCEKYYDDNLVHFELGKLYTFLNKLNDAKIYYKKCLVKNTVSTPLALVELAKISFKEDNIQECENYLNQLDKEKLSKTGNYELAKLYLKMGKTEECKEIVNLLFEEGKDNTLNYILLSRVLLSEDKTDEALNLLLQISKNNESKYHKKVYFMLCVIYSQINDFENAEKYIKKYIELSRVNDPFGHYELGKVHMGKGNYYEAKIEFIKAISIENNNFIHAHFELGRISVYYENYEEAEKYFLKCLELEEGKVAQTHFELGKLYECIGNYEKSEFHYKKSIEIDKGTIVYSFLYLGSLYLKTKEYDKAIECFKKCTNFEGFGHADLGKTYAITGDYENAEKEFQIAFNTAESQRFQTFFEYGRMLISKKDYINGEKYLLIALEMSQGNYKVHRELGKLYEILSYESKSLEHFRLSLEKSYQRKLGFDI